MPPPWVLKPRLEAGTIGIKKVHEEPDLWPLVEALGDRASYHLLEQFVPGDVYHVDSIVNEREVLTAVASRYGRPPFDVSHGGGVFTTQLVERGSGDDRALQAANREVLRRARPRARRVAHRVHQGRRRHAGTSSRRRPAWAARTSWSSWRRPPA